MKVVFVLFDSLNRHLLVPYGGTRITTPNFARLAQRSVTFERHYVGSLPCMPARRDMQTGRLSFLHRSWGPLEPFDNSFPEMLHNAGVYSHLVTDHFHYFEDGGATYHTRYDTYEFIRGQEGDPWKAMVQPPWERLREKYHERQFSDRHARQVPAQHRQSRVHQGGEGVSVRPMLRRRLRVPRSATAMPTAGCCRSRRSIRTSRSRAPERFREDFKTGWNGPIRDWPRYGRVDELPEECEELRANYYAVVALCDFLLGQLLDYFDRHELWDDTALVVTTDHGFLLGEHDFWAKNRMNMYEEIVHIPLFVYDPRRQSRAGSRRRALTQTIGSRRYLPRLVCDSATARDAGSIRCCPCSTRIDPFDAARSSVISAGPSTSPTVTTPTIASLPTRGRKSFTSIR